MSTLATAAWHRRRTAGIRLLLPLLLALALSGCEQVSRDDAPSTAIPARGTDASAQQPQTLAEGRRLADAIDAMPGFEHAVNGLYPRESGGEPFTAYFNHRRLVLVVARPHPRGGGGEQRYYYGAGKLFHARRAPPASLAAMAPPAAGVAWHVWFAPDGRVLDSGRRGPGVSGRLPAPESARLYQEGTAIAVLASGQHAGAMGN